MKATAYAVSPPTAHDGSLPIMATRHMSTNTYLNEHQTDMCNEPMFLDQRLNRSGQLSRTCHAMKGPSRRRSKNTGEDRLSPAFFTHNRMAVSHMQSSHAAVKPCSMGCNAHCGACKSASAKMRDSCLVIRWHS